MVTAMVTLLSDFLKQKEEARKVLTLYTLHCKRNLMEFTLSNSKQFYSTKGDPLLGLKG